MKSNPLFSVIINSHNGAKYLKQALSSVINQSYKKWEIIFWDNLSTDNTFKIITGYKNKKIRYFKSNRFLNLYQARNLALKKAKGKVPHISKQTFQFTRSPGLSLSAVSPFSLKEKQGKSN